MASANLEENISGRLLGVAITFTILNVLFAVLRAVSIQLKGRAFELHDLFSYIGLVPVLGQCALGFIFIYWAGAGLHAQYLETFAPYKVQRDLFLKYPVQIIYVSSFTFPKMSILFLYRRIFVTKTTKIMISVLLVIVVMTWIAETLSGIFQCNPIAYSWNKSLNGSCVNQVVMYRYWSLPNIVTDVVILVLPIPVVWKLNASRWQRTGLTITFCLGGLGLICCIIRFVNFFDTDAFADPTFASIPLQIWTIVEPSLYFIAGVLPTLRPVGLSAWNTASQLLDSYRSRGSPGATSSHYSKDGYRLHSFGRRQTGKPVDGLQSLPSDRQDSDRRCNPDDISVVELRRDVASNARSDGNDASGGGRLSDGGITRTQEFEVVRETV